MDALVSDFLNCFSESISATARPQHHVAIAKCGNHAVIGTWFSHLTPK